MMAQPAEYLWQWESEGGVRVVRDFLIRTYPNEHNRLSKQMFKAPEYCAACHKQFIDQEVNRVGWVQLQNQYDNWKASHWYTEGDPEKTIECRECHMPLVASTDPKDSGLIFLPFLYGCNVSLDGKACFIGLDGWQKRGHVLRANYEGVVFAHRWHMDKL